MDTLTTIIAIIFIVFGILQILLFFKLWEMANDVKRLTNKITPQNEICATEDTAELESDNIDTSNNTGATEVWKCPQCNAINSRRSFGESTCVTCGYTLRR